MITCDVCGKTFEDDGNRPGTRRRRCGAECDSAHGKRRRSKMLADPQKKSRWDVCQQRSALKKYGLMLEDFDRMLLKQAGLCAICCEHLISPRIDHDHVTGKVRGLLCNRCNTRLAPLEDAAFRIRAQAYLAATTTDPDHLSDLPA